MSFIAAILYDGINADLIANWLQKMVINFPFAFFIQIFFIGPFVRKVFGLVFKRQIIKTRSA